MNLSLSQRDRRAVIGGMLTIVAVLGGGRVVPRVNQWSESVRKSARALDDQLSDEAASIRDLRRARDSLIARQVRLLALDSLILEGETPPLAAASLAELVSDVAEDADVQISAVQLRCDTSAKRSFVLVEVEVSATGDLASVAAFLSQLESGTKLLRLKSLALVAQQASGQVSDKAQSVRADVTVVGLGKSRSADPHG